MSLAKHALTFKPATDRASLTAWMQHIHASRDRAKTQPSTSTQQAHSAVVSPSSAPRIGLRSPRTPQRWQALARLLLALVVYGAAFGFAQYGAARLAIAVSPKVGVATPLYVQGAVLVAALLITVPRRWWLYLLVTLLVLPIDLWLLQYPLATAEVIIPLIYVVLVSIAVLVVSLLRRWTVLPLHFATLSEVSRFMACVAVSVIPGTIFITVARSAVLTWNIWFSLETGYLGYLLGIVVFTPAIVLWLTDGRRGLGSITRKQRLELALLSLTTVTVSLLVFVTRFPQADVAHALIYVVVPMLIWAAVRFGPFGLASTLALSTAIAVLGAVDNRGPFADPTDSNNVLALQLYLLCVAVPLYFLAALVRERTTARVDAEHQGAQLQATFEAMPEGVAVYNKEGLPVRANAAMNRLLGLDAVSLDYTALSLDERTARFGARDIHGQPLASAAWPVTRALAGEVVAGAEAVEVQVPTLDGREVTLRVSASPLRSPAGQVDGAVCIFRDVTERIRLERAHIEQAEQLTRVFEGIADGVVVYDADGHLVRTNPAARRLLGLDAAPADYAQRSPADRAAQFEARDDEGRTLPPEEWPLMRALRGQAPSEGEGRAMRLRVLDGREVDLYTNAAPLRDEMGRLLGAVMVVHDQTERTRLEQALAEQAEELERIVEAMGEGLFVYDADGHVVHTNAAARQLLGLDGDGSRFFERSAEERLATYAPRTPDGRPLTAADWHVTRARTGGAALSAPETGDLTLQTVDGRTVDVSATWAPLRTPDGQVMGTVLLVSDRTERNQLAREREEARASELALREVNERLDTFVAMAAHDMRQPVTLSTLRVQMAQRQVLRAAATASGRTQQMLPFMQVAQALDAAHHDLIRLQGRLLQLLDVTQARQGTLVLNRQPCDLAALAQAAVEEQRLLTPDRTLTLNLPDGDGQLLPVLVNADAERVHQVLTNYLVNAVRYTPDDQPIDVTLRVVEHAMDSELGENSGSSVGSERVALVEVRDHGPGIAAEDQLTIWDRFQRARRAREAVGGLGLGLYIARTIIELHGGQVGVESVVGEGATFWFTLPLVHSIQPVL